MVTETRRVARRVRGLAWLLMSLAPCVAAQPASLDAASSKPWPRLRVAVESVSVGDVRLQGARIELQPDGAFVARFERLGTRTEAALLESTTLNGRLDELADAENGLFASGTVRAWGFEAGWVARSGSDGVELSLNAAGQPVVAVSTLPGAPAFLGWLQGGRFDVAAEFAWPATGTAAWAAELAFDGLGFDSPDGRFAGLGLGFDLQGQGGFSGLAGSRATLRATRGELLLDRLYRRFDESAAAVVLETAVSSLPSRLSVRLDDPGALRLDAVVGWPIVAPDAADIEVRSLALEFPGAYRRYLEPVVAAWDLDGLEVTGRADWRGAWRSGEFESGDLDIRDFSVVDTQRERFALTGFNTRLRPGDTAFESRLSWHGLLLGRINLGAGSARLDASPGRFALAEPLTLDVMGGQLRLDAFRYALPGARPVAGRDTFLSASLRGIELGPLTRALGWPEFGGTLNGELPGARLEDGVLSIDGGIGIEVFGGAVAITDLRVERLFGVLPSFAANIELRDLDLEQLTETFSFGRIGGRVDGHVHDLRMLDWKPVAFDAWLGTPERQRGASDISRRAVTRLASIGGGGPTAALSGPLLRFFSNFSYRRVGLGCTLVNYVCEIRGLDDDGAGVLLLEGAGVPRITIRAYNRSVDWPQMVANLVAISEGEPIGTGPASKP